MQEELWKRIRNWLCEKAGHPFRGTKWQYGGQNHFDCKGCGKIVSKDIHDAP